jgi:hypothetical protein
MHLFGSPAISVLVPYDREADYQYLDAIGRTRNEALSHFTSFGRFDLSLGEIFHLEFIEASVRPALELIEGMSCVLPVSIASGEPFVMGMAGSESECRRILRILKEDPETFGYVSAELNLSDVTIL